MAAPEFLALADEEVVPLAAEAALDLAQYDADGQVVALDRAYKAFQENVASPYGGPRDALLQLLATGLAVLGGIGRGAVLFQAPADTRPVRLSTTEFIAYHLGKKRHVIFALDVWRAPREGDVLRLLEVFAGRWTGRDAFAEVLDVSSGHSGGGEAFVTSIRPWRGLGTASSERAILDSRRDALETAQVALFKLNEQLGPGSQPSRLCSIALRSVEKVLDTLVPHPAAEPIAAE